MRDSVNVISPPLLKKLKGDNFMSKRNELQKVKSEIEMKLKALYKQGQLEQVNIRKCEIKNIRKEL